MIFYKKGVNIKARLNRDITVIADKDTEGKNTYSFLYYGQFMKISFAQYSQGVLLNTNILDVLNIDFENNGQINIDSFCILESEIEFPKNLVLVLVNSRNEYVNLQMIAFELNGNIKGGLFSNEIATIEYKESLSYFFDENIEEKKDNIINDIVIDTPIKEENTIDTNIDKDLNEPLKNNENE